MDDEEDEAARRRLFGELKRFLREQGRPPRLILMTPLKEFEFKAGAQPTPLDDAGRGTIFGVQYEVFDDLSTGWRILTDKEFAEYRTFKERRSFDVSDGNFAPPPLFKPENGYPDLSVFSAR